MGAGQVLVQVSLRREALPADAAHEPIHLGLGVRAQVDPVVVNLAEAFATFRTAVWTRASVQIHVFLELELGRKLEVADATAVFPRMTRVYQGREKNTVVKIMCYGGFLR